MKIYHVAAVDLAEHGRRQQRQQILQLFPDQISMILGNQGQVNILALYIKEIFHREKKFPSVFCDGNPHLPSSFCFQGSQGPTEAVMLYRFCKKTESIQLIALYSQIPMAGEKNHRKVPVQFAESSGGFHTVYSRHFDVHEDTEKTIRICTHGFQ